MSDMTSQVPLAPLPPERQPAAVAAAAWQPATPPERRLRLWPGVVIVALLWLVTTLPGWLAPATVIQFYGMMFGPMAAVLALVFRGVSDIQTLQRIDPSPLRIKTAAGAEIQKPHDHL